MATRTEPIPLCSLSFSASTDLTKRGLPDQLVPSQVVLPCTRGLGAVVPWRRVRPSLGGDQLVQPADFALDRLQAVALQLEGVAVDALPGPREPGPEGLDPLFQPAAPALEDPQPDVRRGQAEEGEPDAEPVVLPGGGPGLGKQVLQVLLAVSGQPVDDLGTAAAKRLSGIGHRVLCDEPATGQVLQTRVQRAVTEGAERAKDRVKPLPQIVAVHRSLVQQPEHGELKHAGPLAAHLRSCLLAVV